MPLHDTPGQGGIDTRPSWSAGSVALGWFINKSPDGQDGRDIAEDGGRRHAPILRYFRLFNVEHVGRATDGSITRAIQLSKVTAGTIRPNPFCTFVYNTPGIPIAAGVCYPVSGLMASPILASAAMELRSSTKDGG